ncbi:restin homolog [Sabethes cyaneus]|uniref:restin homolog n=1 Tax=Sabethes cyaneus TaxID=53552 RepID=UPI00237DDBD4|nr:restin homolog [Sabethes cyaneus]
MGSFMSSHHSRSGGTTGERSAEMAEQWVEREENDPNIVNRAPTFSANDDKSCAIVGNKSEVLTINSDTAGSDPEHSHCSAEPCGGSGGKCAELEEFRQELTVKREMRKSKMADIKHEMDQLRKSLAEEKGKNRALIRYIQSQQQTKTSVEPAVGDELSLPAAANDDSAKMVQNESENIAEKQLEQSDSSSSTSTTSPDDLRLALKKDLAESQLQLQIANGEILTLQSVIDQLRAQVQTLRTPSAEEEAAEAARNQELRKLKVELADSQFQLQISNAEVLGLQSDIGQLKNQIKGLKDVIKAGKEIIAIREDQVEQLKAKLRQIEDSLQERELQIMSADLRREYERQMSNIRNLRELYEERERVSRMERDNLLRQLELRKNDLEAEQEKNKNLESHVASMQADLEATKTELAQTKDRLDQSLSESKQLQAEMSVVNQFISKFLLGMSRKQTPGGVNLDKLTEVLEENRGLLIEMTKQEAETIDLGAFLPRALYDLVAEVDEQQNDVPDPEQADISDEDTTTAAAGENDQAAAGGERGWFADGQQASPEQIADKLPKVWRVLIELVNHQERAEPVPFVENGESDDCLKLEQTKNGPKTVVSVSKTYLKLKDLILEKKSLKKETNRLKTLNSHLERRLETQEKRLSAVSLELTKTWHLVGKMQRQHRQLHTQEQILRYHLQQKRRLLSELKEELEYCRLKWSAARQKNIESEDQWRSLKADFASRKKQDSLNNNSGESGYSDEQPTDDEDEEYSGGQNKVQRSKEFRDLLVNFQRCRSASLTNVLSMTVQTVRKCHSETDMKSLNNVERANQFCNEKIEDLPMFPEEEIICPIKKKSKAQKKKKQKEKKGPETAEEMFMRLSGLGQETNADDNDDDDEDDDDDGDDSEEDISEDSQCSEIEKIEQRSLSPVEEIAKEPELTSEEMFNMKREARLKRMEELNSRLDSYATPTRSTDSGSTSTVVEGPSRVLSPTEEDYLQRRAARLERLEREAKEFHSKLSRAVNRGSEISAQIDEIHNGFIARQSESPTAASSSSEQQTIASKTTKLSESEQAALTERERDYTQNRSDRLQRLENQSQSLLDQMNRTLQRGSKLTSRLDSLHSRYNSSEHHSDSEMSPKDSTTVEPSTEDLEVSNELSRNSPTVPVEHQIVPLSASIDTVLLENSIIIPANGPIELVLVSDEEYADEIEVNLHPASVNATSSMEEEQNPNEHNDASSASHQ